MLLAAWSILAASTAYYPDRVEYGEMRCVEHPLVRPLLPDATAPRRDTKPSALRTLSRHQDRGVPALRSQEVDHSRPIHYRMATIYSCADAWQVITSPYHSHLAGASRICHPCKIPIPLITHRIHLICHQNLNRNVLSITAARAKSLRIQTTSIASM